jgi:hypothetical protein
VAQDNEASSQLVESTVVVCSLQLSNKCICSPGAPQNRGLVYLLSFPLATDRAGSEARESYFTSGRLASQLKEEWNGVVKEISNTYRN